MDSRSCLRLLVLVLGALVPACVAPLKTAPMIVGQAKFPEGGGVTSGIQAMSESTMEIEFIDFYGVELAGEGKMAFRWKPWMGDPYHEEIASDVADGGSWKMTARVVYYDTIRRHASLECTLTIVTDGKLEECVLK
jgi:hypothetical protein